MTAVMCAIACAGIGDTLLFLRYLPFLQQRVRQVIAWVPAPLQRFVGQTPGVTLLAGDITDLPNDVMLCGLWELPYLVGAPEALRESSGLRRT